MKSEIVKFNAPELEVIEPSKAKQIKNTFEPMGFMLSNFEESYNEIIKDSKKGIDQELTVKAKRLRIDIGKVRIETEKVRKEQKDEYLRAGKAIDGVSNILKWAVSDKENKLKEIENHFEIKERERLDELQIERAEKISKYLEDSHERDLSSMEGDVWSAYFNSKKKEFEDRIAAEKKAEQDRIAKEKEEAKERERIRKENERLIKESKEREKSAKREESKREAERKERDENERKERELYEAKIKKERDERERVERTLIAKQEAERKATDLEESRLQDELNKGDSAKVKDLIEDLKSLKIKYAFKSAKNKKTYLDVGLLIDKVINHIK